MDRGILPLYRFGGPSPNFGIRIFAGEPGKGARSMRIWSAPRGDEAHLYKKSAVLTFGGPRTVLSTSPFNGGLRRDLAQVFNHCCSPGDGMPCMMRAATYEEHLALVASELGLDPDRSAGLSTAANMEFMAVLTEGWGSANVTAFVTAGLEVNAGRAGDLAAWTEEVEQGKQASPDSRVEGTVNIILHFDCNLSDGALTRALITVTEAKAAALQELMVSSCFSNGIATGSGTDGAILIADASAPLRLTDTGNHSKLGEVTGRLAKRAVKEALRLQTSLTPARQHDLLRLAGTDCPQVVPEMTFRLVVVREDMLPEARHKNLLDQHVDLIAVQMVVYPAHGNQRTIELPEQHP